MPQRLLVLLLINKFIKRVEWEHYVRDSILNTYIPQRLLVLLLINKSTKRVEWEHCFRNSIFNTYNATKVASFTTDK